MLLNQIGQVNKGSCIDQLAYIVFRVYDIWIISTGGHQGEFVLTATIHSKLCLHGDASLASKLLTNSILHIVPVRISFATEVSKCQRTCIIWIVLYSRRVAAVTASGAYQQAC
ncbi:hypothetical protein D1872_288420 [compost metagenome]